MYAKILSMFLLIAAIAQVHCIKIDLSPAVDKCFEKLNVSEEYLKSLKIENLTKEDKTKVACTMGCLLKGQIANDGKTIYQYFLENLEEAVKEDNKSDVGSNLDVLTQGLNSCSNVGDAECKFFECLEKTGQEWKNRVDDFFKLFLSQH